MDSFWKKLLSIMDKSILIIAILLTNISYGQELTSDGCPVNGVIHPGFEQDCPVPAGEQFCHRQYLVANPDVAADWYYGTRPYKHYLLHGKNEGRIKCPAAAQSAWILLQDKEGAHYKIAKFTPVGNPVKLLDGHDLGVTTVTKDGTVWMSTGDGFVGGIKYEAAIFKLSPNDDPMVPNNWKFERGTSGKITGMIVLGSTLFALVSDSGSMYEGSQNVRVWNVKYDWKTATLQDKLKKSGVDWFFAQYPYYSDQNKVLLGCATIYNDDPFAAGTPVDLWEGHPEQLDDMSYLGKLNGLPQKVSFMTLMHEMDTWIAGIGDINIGKIFQYVSHGSVLGPYGLKETDTFSPPMERINMSDVISGPFTLSYVKIGTHFYRVISGYGGTNGGNDAIWIQKVMVEAASSP